MNDKVQEVRLQRDLFGRLLAISMTENPDIQKILSYPITSVPMSMCQMDGTICKTRKSVFLDCIEDGTVPTHCDIEIIDGFYFLHLVKVLPQTFGKIAKLVLQKLTNTGATEIHLIFDQYFQPSIMIQPIMKDP